eukprot:CAMPEP_0117033974 /NCGR_PEP_ID=MMETSP0472-20121206/24237_1 /TAXON_ID=693140 ORGANISM="Tiarina fusus, Strain LIS" /NCGR_SAMPLE_ID=MMETSP0472 /ASSEMBLY_ACC=CAM_ASM_000603 /LENGTH=441 /DNA_ID=CAMNT_0004743045 /DNA_START=51 /DNA_END=1376 /DNA_ORIENTATION=-
MTSFLDSIECSAQPLDFSFHPKRENLLAAGLVDGTLEVHDVRVDDAEGDEDDEPDSILSSFALHTKLLPDKGTTKQKLESCRAVSFSTDGTRLYTGGSAGGLCAMDAERACTFSSKPQKSLLWRVEPATEGKLNPMVAIQTFENSRLLATGDDDGGVRVWDERICGQKNNSSSNRNSKRPNGCVFSWKENDDYISGLEHSQDGNTLLATSADGRLSIFDLRMAREAASGKGQKSYRLSDDQEDELLSLQIMKNGRKVVCGTQEGVLSIFSWGTWGDCSDRFPGHPSSIDALLKVDEDTLLTGSSDGFIRVVQIQPDKLLGVLGDNHEGFPIEKLDFNSSRSLVGSVCHDNYIRLWDAGVLQEGHDGIDSEVEEEGKSQIHPEQSNRAVKASGSDDDWEDMDDNDSDSDDGDNDGEDTEVATANDKRKERLKTDTEKFFDDL